MTLRTETDDVGLSRKLAVVQNSVSALGFWMSARYALVRLLSYDSATDTSFDRRFGTDTSGFIQPEDLEIENEESRKHSVIYLGTPMRVTHGILKSLPIDLKDCAFLDVGCGKGRVLLVASMYPFKRIQGVEASRPLYDIALKNIERFRSSDQQCKKLEVLFVDATAMEFPDEDTLIYLYNPFGPPILKAFLQNLETSLRNKPRRVSIIFVLPSEQIRSTFAEFPFLKLERDTWLLNPDYSWVLYSTG